MKNKFKKIVQKIAAPVKFVGAVVGKPFAWVGERLAGPAAALTAFMNKYSLIFHILWAGIMDFIIEAFSRHSAGAAWIFITGSPWVFAYNTLLIFMTLMITYLFRRRAFVRLLVSAVWLALGYANGTLLNSRVTPFTGQDMHLISDALDLVNMYMSPAELMENVGLVVGIVVILLLFWKFGPKYQGKMHYIRNAVALAAVIALFMGSSTMALENRIISTYFGNIAFAYEDYGFPYCFCCTLLGTGMNKPYDYNAGGIAEISDFGEDEVPETLPNIIFVQLESFFDVTTVDYLTCSEDPIPYFHSLMEEYSSGAFKVPSVGAGTANTEFETITGMNMRYFGPGEYPYKTILKKTTCESIPYDLAGIGYATHAIHNNKATFYSRVDVFPNLGFESFTTKEYMDISNQTETGWLKDEVLVGCILDSLQSTEQQDYIYTISVQGHGDYPTEPTIKNPVITVSGSPTEAKNYQWEYYVNEIHEMDQFVEDLITAVDETGEDSVIVFYGDHLPTMDLTEEDVSNRYLFDTTYVIWDNIGLEKKDQTLCAYQMGAEVMDQLGIHTGTMVQYHQNRKGTKNYLADMETLQYDILYGKKYAYNEEDRYAPAQMRMGIRDGSIEKAVQIEDNLYIFGANFTTQSKIYINGEYQSTGYINNHLIRVRDVTLEDQDELTLKQVAPGSKKRVLSEEAAYTYSLPEKEPETEPEDIVESAPEDTEAAPEEPVQ